MTTWNYDSQRGWLQSKRYQDGTGPDYTYYLSGRLKERLWARGAPRLKTTYTYNLAGDLQTIDYLDTTPDVTYGYNRLGHQISVVQGGNSVTRVYNLAGNLVSETCTAGTLAGLSVSNRFDHWLRRTNVAVINGAAQISASAYAFDAASRLSKVTSGVNSASYRYLANAPLVSQISFTNNGSWRMTTSKQFDQLNRLQSMASVAPTFTAASFEYTYNNANQRTERREADGVYWRYEYDPLGQVKSGKKYWADGTPVAGQQFEYAFDDIGNRTSTKAGGDQNGANLRSASYSPNLLNQYASRTVPGAVDVMGVALATNTVAVDGQAPYRKGEYFRKELTVVNTSVPVWKSLTVSAPGETPVTRSEFVPKTPELFTHDLDGNLVADGRWNYTWDAENRLVAMAARTGVGPQISLKFEYDAQGRRIRKQVWGNAAWSGSATNDLRFVYDGWNLIAVLSPQSTVLRSFTWGVDLSGSLQGAGGVGGLLMVNDTANGVHFPAFDGNGNVAALVKSDGTLSAQYEYGPFAEVLRATGPMARANPFRFSTKYQDDETDLLYYGYRYYSAITGRWLSRDPIEEKGGKNLYAFVRNEPLYSCDFLGQACLCGPDITDAFYGYLTSIVSELKKLPSNLTGPIDGLATLLEVGGNIDFWYRGKVAGCATESCGNSVWFSGVCVRSTVINNILFGFVANALGVMEHDAVKGASIHNKVINGSFEGEEQEGAYDIGYDLWDAVSQNGKVTNSGFDEVIDSSIVVLPMDSLKLWFNSKSAINKAFRQCKPCGKAISIEQVDRVGNGFSTSRGPIMPPRQNHSPRGL